LPDKGQFEENPGRGEFDLVGQELDEHGDFLRVKLKREAP